MRERVNDNRGAFLRWPLLWHLPCALASLSTSAARAAGVAPWPTARPRGGAAGGSAASTLPGLFIVTPATRRTRAAGGCSWTTCSFPVGWRREWMPAFPQHTRLHAGPGPGVRGDLAGRGWHRPRSGDAHL